MEIGKHNPKEGPTFPLGWLCSATMRSLLTTMFNPLVEVSALIILLFYFLNCKVYVSTAEFQAFTGCSGNKSWDGPGVLKHLLPASLESMLILCGDFDSGKCPEWLTFLRDEF